MLMVLGDNGSLSSINFFNDSCNIYGLYICTTVGIVIHTTVSVLFHFVVPKVCSHF